MGWILLLVFLAVFIGLMVASAQQKLIFYNSLWDLVLAFSPWATFLLGGVVIGLLTPEQSEVSQLEWQAWETRKETVLISFTIASGVVALGLTLQSIRLNGSFFIGVLVAPFKIFYALVLPVVAMAAVAQVFGKDKSLTVRALWLTIFGIFWWMTDMLIKGDESDDWDDLDEWLD